MTAKKRTIHKGQFVELKNFIPKTSSSKITPIKSEQQSPVKIEPDLKPKIIPEAKVIVISDIKTKPEIQAKPDIKIIKNEPINNPKICPVCKNKSHWKKTEGNIIKCTYCGYNYQD